MANVVLDTYAWIEYFRGTEEGEKVRGYVENSSDILTPAIVIAELSDKYKRTGKEQEWEIRRHFIKIQSEISDLDFETAENGGKLKWELREENKEVGLADSIILSHVLEHDRKLLTGDEDLTFRPEVEDISK